MQPGDCQLQPVGKSPYSPHTNKSTNPAAQNMHKNENEATVKEKKPRFHLMKNP
jgi:hypothetical protein